MLRNTSVISISLPPEILTILEQLTRKTSKTRSEIIRDLLVSYRQEKSWEQVFSWGRKTKEQFNIRSEDDILKIIND
ncbi:ribbon-helix-helix protein, CopG family [Candidatus Gottesmanbacteria bacterium]|nr:ribbon-helix-helix protein, CopG family [Candidatus Gottesmanbacteria bacterium]